MNLEILPKGSSGNIIIDDALKSLFSEMPDQASEAVASQVNQMTDMVKDQARSSVPDIDARFTATTALYDVDSSAASTPWPSTDSSAPDSSVMKSD